MFSEHDEPNVAQSCNRAPSNRSAQRNSGDWTNGSNISAMDQVRQWLAIKTMHRCRKILLIFNLFMPSNKGTINFGTDETPHRDATPPAVQPTLDTRRNVSIAHYAVTIMDYKRTIACMRIPEMRRIQERHIFPYVSRQENWWWIEKLRANWQVRFEYWHNGRRQETIG